MTQTDDNIIGLHTQSATGTIRRPGNCHHMTNDANTISLQAPRRSLAAMHAEGQENIDVIALLGCTCPVKAATSMRRLGWSEAEIRQWLGA